MAVFGGNMGRTLLVERRPCSIRRDAALPVRSGGATCPSSGLTGPEPSRMRTVAQPEIVAEPAEALEADLPPIEYPCSDGVVMSENDFQAGALLNARHFLGTHFREHRDVAVSGNIFVYFQPGNLSMTVSPDILVGFGVERRKGRSYRT